MRLRTIQVCVPAVATVLPIFRAIIICVSHKPTKAITILKDVVVMPGVLLDLIIGGGGVGNMSSMTVMKELIGM